MGFAVSGLRPPGSLPRRGPSQLARHSPGYSLDLIGLVLPRADRLLGLNLLAAVIKDPSTSDYVGLPLLLVLLALAVFAWRSRITRLLVLTFAVIIALALGPALRVDGRQVLTLPWGSLWSVSVLRSAETNRFIVFGWLVLAIALARWLAQPARSRLVLAARWGLGLLAIAALLADLPTFAEVVVPATPSYQAPVAGLHPADALPAFITDGAYRRSLSRGETVVVVSERGNAGMLFQAATGFYFRIAGGFINQAPVDALPVPVASLQDPTRLKEQQFLSYVRTAHVGAVIVEQAWSEKWMSVFGQLGLKSSTVGGVIVYRTARTAAG